MLQISLLRNRPASHWRRRSDDDKTRVLLVQECEVLHQHLAKLLCEEVITGWSLIADREKDFVGRVEA
jgi:hypothetical protein